MVKSLYDGNDVHCVDTARARVCEDGDQHMLLQGEGAGVHREGPARERHVDGCGREGRGHQPAQRKDRDLSTHGRYRNLVLAVAEELVQEGQDHAGRDPEDPCSERQGRLLRVVGDRDREPDLLDRVVVNFLFRTWI